MLILVKHHRLIPADQDPILKVMSHGRGQDHSFQVAAFADQVVDGVAVVHGGDWKIGPWA